MRAYSLDHITPNSLSDSIFFPIASLQLSCAAVTYERTLPGPLKPRLALEKNLFVIHRDPTTLTDGSLCPTIASRDPLLVQRGWAYGAGLTNATCDKLN